MQCPCAAIEKAKEAKIEAQRKDEEIRKKLEKRNERDKERQKREELIEKRRQQYYQKLKRAEEKPESKPKIHDPAALTKLDSKRSSMKTMDQISEISRDFGQPLDLVLMDGTIKTLKEEYYEEGGMVMQSLHIDTLPDYIKKSLEKVSEKAELKESVAEEEKDETIMDDLQSLDSDRASVKSEGSSKQAVRTGDSVPFEKFLDFMEIFWKDFKNKAGLVIGNFMFAVRFFELKIVLPFRNIK